MQEASEKARELSEAAGKPWVDEFGNKHEGQQVKDGWAKTVMMQYLAKRGRQLR